MNEKRIVQETVDESQRDSDGSDVIESNGTSNDVRDMFRLGKKQEFKRDFSSISIIGFMTIMTSSWESTLLVPSFGLLNGGTAGLIWNTIAVSLCTLALSASMAEMASMAPTSGGQYHWVSEFAPSSLQQPLSFVVGWCCCLGWIAAIPAAGQMLAGLVQGMVLLVNPDVSIGSLWQVTLLIFLFMFLTFAFNVFFSKYLAVAESIILVIHCVGFIIFLGVLWGTSEIAPASQVFTQTNDGGGWGNAGLATLVGLVTPLWCFLAPDAGSHMAEELRDASLVLPKTMIWATLSNAIMGSAMMITFCFCVGNVDDVLNSPTGIPIIQVIYNSTQSIAGTCIMGFLLIVLVFCGMVTAIATISRQCWAFSRDRGFPCSIWISKVQRIWGAAIPLNAIIVCLGVSVILASINFGSDVALAAIVSVSNAALIFSYFVSVGCVRLKRWRGEELLPRRWNLGRFGAPLNDVALIFLVVTFVFSFFPLTPMVGDPTWAADFNWAIVMFAATCLLAFAYYWLGGKKVYVPPVRLVRNE